MTVNRYKYAGEVIMGIEKLLAGEPYVFLELPSMTYRQTDVIRNRAKYYAKEMKGFEIYIRTMNLDNLTVLFMAEQPSKNWRER
jgi:hypothetical protein